MYSARSVGSTCPPPSRQDQIDGLGKSCGAGDQAVREGAGKSSMLVWSHHLWLGFTVHGFLVDCHNLCAAGHQSSRQDQIARLGHDQIILFRTLICTGSHRNPAACGTNQGYRKQRFAPPLRTVGRATNPHVKNESMAFRPLDLAATSFWGVCQGKSKV